jgi:pimeloyl-ACP methyl ester carboxylesterase
VPVLYVAGELDAKYAGLAETYASLGAKTELVPGAGHVLPLEAPEAVAMRVARFLR